MNAKHTPGPWVAIRHDGFCDTEWRIKPAPPIKGSTVGFAPHAVVKGDVRIVNETEKQANARLIAAAPELLEALIDLCNSNDEVAHPQWKGSPDEIAARAAIAKARGEA